MRSPRRCSSLALSLGPTADQLREPATKSLRPRPADLEPGSANEHRHTCEAGHQCNEVPGGDRAVEEKPAGDHNQARIDVRDEYDEGGGKGAQRQEVSQ